ncbi:MAG: hypothetical protein C0467_11055 [Planctomycetaceae bacterium]|nr:hypothetical protein [Planctomycetaceae bacterium]
MKFSISPVRYSAAFLACAAVFPAFLAGCVRNSTKPTSPTLTNTKAVDPKEESREERIGRRLMELQPGMPQTKVEEILGPPNADVMQSAGLDGLSMAGYLCVLPDNPAAGNRLMVLYYDTTVDPPQFIEMTGPHFPGEK